MVDAWAGITEADGASKVDGDTLFPGGDAAEDVRLAFGSAFAVGIGGYWLADLILDLA